MAKNQKIIPPEKNPYGIYSPDSIKVLSLSDQRNKLYRELAYPRLIKKYGLKEGGTLLDLGAGCGGTSVVWENLGFDVTATDIQPFFVKYLKELNIRSNIVDATNIQNSELKGKQFDVIFASGLTPQVRRIYDNAMKTYKSIGNALKKDGFFIFEFSIARTYHYKKTYYSPSEIIEMIDELDFFEVVDTHKIKACPARLYQNWNKYPLFFLDKLFSPSFGRIQRYILKKV